MIGNKPSTFTTKPQSAYVLWVPMANERASKNRVVSSGFRVGGGMSSPLFRSYSRFSPHLGLPADPGFAVMLGFRTPAV